MSVCSEPTNGWISLEKIEAPWSLGPDTRVSVLRRSEQTGSDLCPQDMGKRSSLDFDSPFSNSDPTGRKDVTVWTDCEPAVRAFESLGK